MTADGLLSVTPEALAKAILARRKAKGEVVKDEEFPDEDEEMQFWLK